MLIFQHASIDSSQETSNHMQHICFTSIGCTRKRSSVNVQNRNRNQYVVLGHYES